MSVKGKGFFRGKTTESSSMADVNDLPDAKGKRLSWKQKSALGGAGFALAACTTAIAAIATQSQASTATPEATLVLPPTTTPESPTPTPTPPPPVEGPFTGFYFGLQEQDGKKTLVGGVDGNKIEADLQARGLNGYKVPIVDGAHEARINTYYYKDTPGQVSAFSSDNEYLMKYFKVIIGKDGSIKGQLPGGGVVEKKGNLWVTTATDGSPLVLNPLIMSRAGQLFGAPVILEKGGKVFLALVDANTGGLVTNPQDAFQTPAAVAAANGFNGPQTVGSVELTKSGLMVVKDPDGKFLAELNFSGRAVTFEQWVQTSTPDAELLKQAQAAYAEAMGIDASKIETSVQMKVGVNGPFAVVVDKVTGMPLLISSTNAEGSLVWENATERRLLDIVNAQREASGLPKLYIGGKYSDVFAQIPKDSVDNVFGNEFNEAFLTTSWWHQTEKRENTFTLDAAIKAATKAKENGMFVIGGQLVYPYSEFQYTYLKDKQGLREDELSTIMKRHIIEVMTPLIGRVDAWIVVNESRVPTETLNGITYDSFNKIIGEKYIEDAFQTARNTDPEAILIYNETFNERTLGPNGGWYTTRTQEIVRRLKAKNLIDGVGVLMHIDASNPPNIADMIQTLKNYGIPVFVTEFDIDVSKISGSTAEKEEIRAQLYSKILRGVIDSGVCNVINHWNAEKGSNGELFNGNLDPTQSLFAERKALFDLIK